MRCDPGGVGLRSWKSAKSVATIWIAGAWRFTDASARRLFSDVFGTQNVTVATYGNVLAGCAFLHGLTIQKLREAELDHHDADYQVTIGIRAVRSVEHKHG
jgi:hypothetical protein